MQVSFYRIYTGNLKGFVIENHSWVAGLMIVDSFAYRPVSVRLADLHVVEGLAGQYVLLLQEVDGSGLQFAVIQFNRHDSRFLF